MGAWLKKFSEVVRKRGSQIAVAVLGQTFYRIFNYFVDFVFCPALILWLGMFYGSAIYVLSTLAIDLGSMVLYDNLKRDILGLELGKELRGWFGERVLRSRAKISDLSLPARLLVTLGLTAMMGPFQIVVFMRQANEYREKMSAEEHIIFWLSFVVGNLYWVLVVGGVIQLGKFLF